jgi:hypothetical protein
VDDLVLGWLGRIGRASGVLVSRNRRVAPGGHVDQPDLLQCRRVQCGGILYAEDTKVTLTQLLQQVAEAIRVTQPGRVRKVKNHGRTKEELRRLAQLFVKLRNEVSTSIVSIDAQDKRGQEPASHLKSGYACRQGIMPVPGVSF